jgi:hypothetical protein
MATAVARLTVEPRPLRAARPDAPAAVETIVMRCLARDVDARYADAGLLADALEMAADHTASRVAVAAATTGALDATHAPAGPSPRPPSTAPAGPAPAGPAPRPAPRSGTQGARPRPPAPGRAPAARRRKRWPAALLVLAILVAAGGVAYLAVDQGVLDGSDANPSGGLPSTNPAPVLVGVNDYDPFGDNGQEHPETVANAIDGNLVTTWTTETYNSRAVGGKRGVGLVLRLVAPADVSRLEVDTTEPGWDAQVYVVPDKAPAAFSGWGEPVGSITNGSMHATITLDPARRAGAVLLWFTFLPETRKLDVAEVRVA